MSQTPFHDMTGPEALLEKLHAERADVSADPLSTRHAMNASLTAWHMTTWVWKHRIKHNWDYRSQLRLGRGGHGEFVAAVMKQCPELSTMEGVSNATKHLALEVAVDVAPGPYGPGYSDGFDKGDRLVVTDHYGSNGVPFRGQLKRVVIFWEDFLEQYPESETPPGAN
ncbi:MAG: hypothetical protein ACR2NL_03770 [Acidimicrobiia bacterium]